MVAASWLLCTFYYQIKECYKGHVLKSEMSRTKMSNFNLFLRPQECSVKCLPDSTYCCRPSFFSYYYYIYSAIYKLDPIDF